DVEVIVHLYESLQDGFIERLRGMFAVAIWDARRQRLVLGRDRLGIKPLFYAPQGGGVLFGSEIKSLVRGGLLDLHLDPHALDRYLTFGYVPSPLTIYKEIRKLDPGHLLVCDARGLVTGRYWRLRFAPVREANETRIGERFLELFGDAVRSHLM